MKLGLVIIERWSNGELSARRVSHPPSMRRPCPSPTTHTNVQSRICTSATTSACQHARTQHPSFNDSHFVFPQTYQLRGHIVQHLAKVFCLQPIAPLHHDHDAPVRLALHGLDTQQLVLPGVGGQLERNLGAIGGGSRSCGTVRVSFCLGALASPLAEGRSCGCGCRGERVVSLDLALAAAWAAAADGCRRACAGGCGGGGGCSGGAGALAWGGTAFLLKGGPAVDGYVVGVELVGTARPV